MKKATIILLLALLTVSSFCAWQEKANANKKVITVGITIVTGDTLWNRVADLKERYNDKRDIREIIYNIQKDNDLKVAAVYPGQKLQVTMEATK